MVFLGKQNVSQKAKRFIERFSFFKKFAIVIGF